MKKISVSVMLIAGGAAMYLAVEDIKKGALLVAGSILLDIGIDELMLLWEKWRGEID